MSDDDDFVLAAQPATGAAGDALAVKEKPSKPLTNDGAPRRWPPGKRQERFPQLVSLKVQRFAQLRALGLSGNRAYALAFEGTATARSRRANACRLEREPMVDALIKQFAAERTERLKQQGEAELEFLQSVMLVSVQDLFDEDGRAIKIQDLPRNVSAAIKKIGAGRYGPVVELRDSLKAAELRLRVVGRLRDAARPGVSLEELVAGTGATLEGHDK